MSEPYPITIIDDSSFDDESSFELEIPDTPYFGIHCYPDEHLRLIQCIAEIRRTPATIYHSPPHRAIDSQARKAANAIASYERDQDANFHRYSVAELHSHPAVIACYCSFRASFRSADPGDELDTTTFAVIVHRTYHQAYIRHPKSSPFFELPASLEPKSC